VCRFYLKGLCRYGTRCRFSHPAHENSSEEALAEEAEAVAVAGDVGEKKYFDFTADEPKKPVDDADGDNRTNKT
jgi:hypothetical protein